MANLNAKTFFGVCSVDDFFEARSDKALRVKAGRVTLHKAQAQWIYEHKLYIITSSAVYQPRYSVNAGFYFSRLLYTPGARYAARGRFHVLTAKDINNVLGYELLNA